MSPRARAARPLGGPGRAPAGGRPGGYRDMGPSAIVDPRATVEVVLARPDHPLPPAPNTINLVSKKSGAVQGAASEFAESAPWLPIFPGLAISLGVFAFNLFGDSLRDALDPRLRTL